jgi:hypothetical protein
MLDGIRRDLDEMPLWDSAANVVGKLQKAGKCRVEAAVLSPAKTHLAICCEMKTLLGLRTNHLGAIYDIARQTAVGQIVSGKRSSNGWSEQRR